MTNPSWGFFREQVASPPRSLWPCGYSGEAFPILAHWRGPCIDFRISWGLTSPAEMKPGSAALPPPLEHPETRHERPSLLSPPQGFALLFPVPKPHSRVCE